MVAAIGAVAAVGGAVISANASDKAADQQSQSAADATAAQERAAAQTRQDLLPWTQQGVAANNALGYYLGLNPGGTSGAGAAAPAQSKTYDQIRQELIGQYTTTTPGADAKIPQYWSQADTESLSNREREDLNTGKGAYLWEGTKANTAIDEARLESEIQSRLRSQQEQQAAYDAQTQAASGDPRYGSLLQAYRNGEEFDAGPAFSFTGEDLASEPGYKFGLDQGMQGIDRAQASRGNFLSGAAIKEANRYSQDYAGTKFNDAFNRSLTGYNTNLTARQNEWNTNLNAYNGNRDRIYNFLTGVSTLGQNSAAQTASSNQQAATQAGNNLLASGNAQSAATVAGGNSLQSGINSAVNAYREPTGVNSASGWNQLLAAQSGQSQNTGTNYLQNGYDALGMPNNI